MDSLESLSAMRALSKQQYHQMFLNKKVRVDGRKFDESRDVEITINQLESCDGHSMVKFGNTKIMCGVKGTIVSPKFGDEVGIIEISTKLPPNSLHEFKWSRDASMESENSLATKLERILIKSKCLDLKSLVVEPGKHVWKLELELICFDFDGNVVDAAVMAMTSALMATELPTIDVPVVSENGMFNFREETKRLEMKKLPFSTTFALMRESSSEGSVGIRFIDPSAEEELLGEGFVTVISTPEEEILSIEKQGQISLSDKELIEVVNESITRNKSLHQFVLRHM